MLEQLNYTLLQQEAVNGFAMFQNKLENEIVPEEFVQVMKDDSVTFHYIRDDSNKIKISKFINSVVVESDLEVKTFQYSAPLSHNTFKHLMPEKRLKKMSELLNILALCKSLADSDSSSAKREIYIEIAVNMLEWFVAQHEKISFQADGLNVAVIIFIDFSFLFTQIKR